MKPMRCGGAAAPWRVGAAAVALLLTWPLPAAAVLAQADGVTVGAGSSTGARTRGEAAAPAAPGQDATLTLRAAVLEAVDLPGRRVVLHGQAVALDAAVRVRLAGQAGELGVSALRAGQRVRVALAGTGVGETRRVVLVLIDG